MTVPGPRRARGRTGGPRLPMPAGAEAIRAERAAGADRLVGVAVSPSPAPGVRSASPGPLQGRAIIRSAWIGTAVYVMATVAATLLSEARIVAAGVDLALFFAGSGLYLWGWGVAARRSREVEITLWNLILLEGVAPRPVRIRVLAAVGVQVAVAAATCWITAALAFGWLVPMWGVAHCQLWGARYGVFSPRRPPAIKAAALRSSR